MYSLVVMKPQADVLCSKTNKLNTLCTVYFCCLFVYCLLLLFVCLPQSHLPESSRSHQQQQLHSHTQGVREGVLKLCFKYSPRMLHVTPSPVRR